eukprot:TRINITY_DN33286_c0_g1_i1.p1 TRINITY_DN33286_c0_g1~~TRINITY_DN33286_c0_g1_i1.p1  ORF type:complete len:834 (-),score=127.09 TRINITY_DN33286_c0_g1_i1:50-2530(-)
MASPVAVRSGQPDFRRAGTAPLMSPTAPTSPLSQRVLFRGRTEGPQILGASQRPEVDPPPPEMIPASKSAPAAPVKTSPPVSVSSNAASILSPKSVRRVTLAAGEAFSPTGVSPTGVRQRAFSQLSPTAMVTMQGRPAPPKMVIMPSSTGVQWVDASSSAAASKTRASWANMSEVISPLESRRPANIILPGSGSASPEASERGDNDDDDDERSASEEEEAPLPDRTRSFSRRYSWTEYPTTPLFLDSAASSSSKATGSEPRIGIDIGGVLTRDSDPNHPCTSSKGCEWDASWLADGALDAVRKIVQVFGPSNTFLVSKVKPGGDMHCRTEKWLNDLDFCGKTGLPKENVKYCRKMDGPQGKGVVCQKLGISHFIDDKVEVLKSVFEDEAGNSRYLIERWQGLLFHFSSGGWRGEPPDCDTSHLSPIMRRHYKPVSGWSQVLELLRNKLPGPLEKRGRELLVPASPRSAKTAPWQPPADSRPPGPWERNSKIAFATTGERPKLNLKPRDPRLGPAGAAPATAAIQQPVAQPVPAVAVVSSQHRALSPVHAAPQVVQQPTCFSPSGRPKLMLKPRTTVPAPAEVVPQAVAQPAGPALQPDPNGGRPKLVLTRRSQPPAVSSGAPAPSAAVRATSPVREHVDVPLEVPIPEAQPAAPALQPDPNGGRPRLVLKKRSEPPAAAVNTATRPSAAVRVTSPVQRLVAPAAPSQVPEQPLPAAPQPALQPDPNGGRPRLVLKKRSDAPAAVQGVSAPSAAVRATSPVQRQVAAMAPPASAAPVVSQAQLGAAQAAAAIASMTSTPALQKDPSGARPKLMLKPRTKPLPSEGAP